MRYLVRIVGVALEPRPLRWLLAITVVHLAAVLQTTLQLGKWLHTACRSCMLPAPFHVAANSDAYATN